MSNYDSNGRRGGEPGPQPEAVERGRQVAAAEQDPAGQLAELRGQQQRVQRMLAGLLRTPDARRNVWTPTLARALREMADDAD